MSDATELIRAYCAQADADAFRRFYRSQSPRVWKFLIARGCDPETAYDLLAEAFLKFIQVVCKDPHAPVALLYRIAINLRIDHFRHHRASPIDAVADIDALESASAAEPDDHIHVRALIAALPGNEQNLLLLRYWIGLTHKEIAQALDMPEGTVRRQGAAALHTLREWWEKHG